MEFNKPEIRDLLKAWFFITLIFTIFLSRVYTTETIIENIILSAIAVGIGFLLHELAHKYVAQKYGLKAYFASYDGMIWLSILLAFIGIIFIAPGAVRIYGQANPSRLGRIAAAGPITNIVLAVVFMGLHMLYPMRLFSFGAYINAILAVFNLIPVLMLDGKKIIQWSKSKYYTILAFAAITLLFSFNFI